MENFLKKSQKIFTSTCDDRGQISIPAVFNLFMDLATEHGTAIKLGADDLMKKGCIWLTSKTKVVFHKLPKFMDEVELETWPEKPGNVRCNRYYTISKDGEILIEGKSEWAIINVESQKLTKLSEVYNNEIIHREDKVADKPFTRMSDDFGSAEILEKYKIRSTDIDTSHHMNNVAYVKMIFGAFTTEELGKMNFKEIDVLFKSQSFEGEVLTICKRPYENGFDIGVLHENGSVAVEARFIFN
ncbi:MAG: hypothetical protein E7564_07365 [Ruminococcaceae bacterium]|nr:hypothetical protein [Oscillospiraceae bacterium]